jgi:hypothetical protein
MNELIHLWIHRSIHSWVSRKGFFYRSKLSALWQLWKRGFALNIFPHHDALLCHRPKSNEASQNQSWNRKPKQVSLLLSCSFQAISQKDVKLAISPTVLHSNFSLVLTQCSFSFPASYGMLYYLQSWLPRTLQMDFFTWVFCRMSSHLSLSLILSLWSDWDYGFAGWRTEAQNIILTTLCEECTLSLCLISVDVYLSHLAHKVVIRFMHFKANPFLPFQSTPFRRNSLQELTP